SVDGVYANLLDLKGKLKEKIEAGKDVAYLSKNLATINTNCAVSCDLSSMILKTPFSEEVRKKFIQLEFKSIVKKDELFEVSADIKEAESVRNQVNLVTSNDVSLFDSVKGKSICVVIENSKISVYDVDLHTCFELKIGQTLLDDGAILSDALSSLWRLFDDRKVILYNKKDFKHYLLETIKYSFDFPCEDISLMKYVADFNGNNTLSDLQIEYGVEKLPSAYALYCIFCILQEKLSAENMEGLYRNMELPLSDVLFEMENSGFKVNYDSLNQTSRRYKENISELEIKIKELLGEQNLNINSPKQLGEVLFEKLKLGKGKKNAKGFSTSAEVLEKIEDTHPAIPLILKYRQIQKLQSTYVEGFKPLIDKQTGLVHTSFNQTVTATGRLSSKEPNLQNIPVRDDEGRELRKLFVPRSSERVLISADYSQIELRLLAAFSGCTGLIKAFREGDDVHSITASKVFKVPLTEVTSSMRRSAKAVNFGIIYGISEYGLAKNLNVSNAQAREYINSYFQEYPEVKKYMDDNVAFAKENGYAKTFFGRKRYIKELASSNFNLRQFGERVAMNMPLQGASADIIKIAMVNVHNRLKREGLKTELILQIHDELILDAFIEESEQAEKILKEEMEG
ncbi:MAG: DNA polymerase I, partial [Clostridia bacterium]|nr:DNA polymerase I [Clostridia bacterium]